MQKKFTHDYRTYAVKRELKIESYCVNARGAAVFLSKIH
jgi:hypothetical protein